MCTCLFQKYAIAPCLIGDHPLRLVFDEDTHAQLKIMYSPQASSSCLAFCVYFCCCCCCCFVVVLFLYISSILVFLLFVCCCFYMLNTCYKRHHWIICKIVSRSQDQNPIKKESMKKEIFQWLHSSVVRAPV